MTKQVTLLVFLIPLHSLFAQEKFTDAIRLNQIGFYPNSQKTAILADEKATEFFIASVDRKEKFFSGRLSELKQSAFSPRKTRVIDFTAFNKAGSYVILVPGVGYSHAFDIKSNVLLPVARASIKAFYFQRFSIPLSEQYAGKWKRPASSPHTEILIHPSAASEKRPAGTIVSSPRGWIDAGDYNKYVVNSGITTGTLLAAYEDFPSCFDTLNLNIPESKNEVPDLLDEALWNIRWMLTMQDPEDGGVYHKCTNAKFDPMVMPHQATTPRYMVQKGTGAALNFAAVMAQSARVFSKFKKQFPGLADSCLTAAKSAWEWAQKNPDVPYEQYRINQQFDPDIATGAYGDRVFTDEFIWAACELLVTTGDERFIHKTDLLSDASMPVPSWNQVKLLGFYTLLRFQDRLSGKTRSDALEIQKRILAQADEMTGAISTRTYQTVMGATQKDFVWGSNAVAANQGILLLQAYRLSKDKKYLEGARANLDYILGRNATGYCFVTGYGDKPPMHPHHRPSESDGVEDPVPGLLAGGPNPGMQDKCQYLSSVPDEAYVDDVCSYASNEIAINWNAPLAYLCNAIQVLSDQ